MVFGQMNEPPGARLRVGLSALTMAEYFRDVMGQDVLLFIDNIFRFVQAGSEVSALLGRMPSAVGYQPTLASEMGELQERITSTRRGSVTSVQAIYVPADDLTDPAPASQLRPPRRHHGAQPGHLRDGHLSGRRPARLHQPQPVPRRRGRRALRDRHQGAGDPAALQGPAGHHRHPGHGRALRRGQGHRAPGPQDPAVPVAAVLRGRAVHRHARASTCRSKRRSAASRRSSRASTTTCPSRPSTYAGGIDDVVAAAKASSAAKTGADAAAPAAAAPAWRGELVADGRHGSCGWSWSRPTGPVFEGDVDMVVVPAVTGEMGILPRHAPLVAQLTIGQMRVLTAERRLAHLPWPRVRQGAVRQGDSLGRRGRGSAARSTWRGSEKALARAQSRIWRCTARARCPRTTDRPVSKRCRKRASNWLSSKASSATRLQRSARGVALLRRKAYGQTMYRELTEPRLLVRGGQPLWPDR